MIVSSDSGQRVSLTSTPARVTRRCVRSIATSPNPNAAPTGLGTGVGAVEVPRGILYHSYTFDKDGRIVSSDCVIPTSQNHANIQHDLEELSRQYALKGKRDRDIELLAQMLVRSYDPCISCSVH